MTRSNEICWQDARGVMVRVGKRVSTRDWRLRPVVRIIIDEAARSAWQRSFDKRSIDSPAPARVSPLKALLP